MDHFVCSLPLSKKKVFICEENKKFHTYMKLLQLNDYQRIA